MGNCTGSHARTPIEAALQKDARAHKRNKEGPHGPGITVLLLGTGDSGKSTIFKQMKALYLFKPNEVAAAELDGCVSAVHTNIVEGAKTLVEVIQKKSHHGFELPPITSQDGRDALLFLQNYLPKAPNPLDTLTAGFVTAVKNLWKTPAAQAIWEHRSNFQIPDSFAYFMRRLDQVGPFDAVKGDAWTPTEEDWLRVRNQTTGINRASFNIDQSKFNVIDVGGQRAERKKWLQVVEQIRVILFVAACSEYDQYLYEDRSVLRLEESLNVFNSTVNAELFLKSSFILFLNKSDLFDEKLVQKRIPLNVSGRLPQAPDTFDRDVALDFIKNLYHQRILRAEQRDPEWTEQTFLVHITCAIDRQNAEVVLRGVKNSIVSHNIDSVGM